MSQEDKDKDSEKPANAPTIEADGRWRETVDGIMYVFREAKVKEEILAHNLGLNDSPLDCRYSEGLHTVCIVAHRIIGGKEEEIKIQELADRDTTFGRDLLSVYYRGLQEKYRLRKKSLTNSTTPPLKPAEQSPAQSP